MNKRQLEEIKDLCKDLGRLKKQLEHITGSLQISHATVKRSTKTFPYIEQIITVSGISKSNFEKAVASTKRSLEVKIDEIMAKITIAQAYIDAVPDADVRLVLQGKYINGLNFAQIEDEFGMPHTTAHRKYKKWLRDNNWD